MQYHLQEAASSFVPRASIAHILADSSDRVRFCVLYGRFFRSYSVYRQSSFYFTNRVWISIDSCLQFEFFRSINPATIWFFFVYSRLCFFSTKLVMLQFRRIECVCFDLMLLYPTGSANRIRILRHLSSPASYLVLSFIRNLTRMTTSMSSLSSDFFNLLRVSSTTCDRLIQWKNKMGFGYGYLPRPPESYGARFWILPISQGLQYFTCSTIQWNQALNIVDGVVVWYTLASRYAHREWELRIDIFKHNLECVLDKDGIEMLLVQSGSI